MVKKLQKLSNDKKKTGAQLSSTVKDSAQQIWLAGLGAFSKAQEEGGKVFDTLVKEGLSIQRKTQSVAEERINVPANPRHYWRYRMHLTLEQLMKADSLNEKIKGLIEQTGRKG